MSSVEVSPGISPNLFLLSLQYGSYVGSDEGGGKWLGPGNIVFFEEIQQNVVEYLK